VVFLRQVIDDAIVKGRADPRRVYVTGFSNGAAMAFRVAAELADRVAAVAPVAGYCRVPADFRPARPVPTLYLIGAADPLVPVRGGDVRSPWKHRLVRRRPVAETLSRWAHIIGCSPDPVPESDADGVRTDVYPGPVPFRAVVIDGLGHHWPGGKGQLNHRIAGPASDRVDGVAAVWEFCRGFRT
jgi:polyhydroxybutyrate depolymerase